MNEGMKEGRKEGRREGRKEGRKEVRKDRWKEGNFNPIQDKIIEYLYRRVCGGKRK